VRKLAAVSRNGDRNHLGLSRQTLAFRPCASVFHLAACIPPRTEPVHFFCYEELQDWRFGGPDALSPVAIVLRELDRVARGWDFRPRARALSQGPTTSPATAARDAMAVRQLLKL